MQKLRVCITVLDTIELDDNVETEEIHNLMERYAEDLQEAMDSLNIGGAVNDVEFEIESD